MYAKGQLNLHIQYQCSVLKIKIVPVREVHKVDIRICFNQYVSCDVKFYPDNMDPVVCFFMTSYMYGQVLLTSGSQVHVCCKLVTCDSVVSFVLWSPKTGSRVGPILVDNLSTLGTLRSFSSVLNQSRRSQSV